MMDTLMPRGWPLVAPGLFVGFVGRIYVALLGKDLDLEGWKVYLGQEAGLVGDEGPARYASIVHIGVPRWWSETALSQKAKALSDYAAMINRCRPIITKRLAASAIVTKAPVVRAALRTLSAFSGDVVPNIAFKTSAEGLRHCANHLSMAAPELDDLKREYAALLTRYAPELADVVAVPS
jgi:hypothetical protein